MVSTFHRNRPSPTILLVPGYDLPPTCDYKMHIYYRGGSRNSLTGGGGGSGPEFFEGGGGVRVQVRGNFHILTSKKKKKTSEGGV